MKGLEGIKLKGRWLGKLISKETRFAAVDIGSADIKAVEVSIADGCPTVTAYGRHPTPVNALDDPVDEEALVDALREVIPASGLQSEEVSITIGGDKVITRHIRLPVMSGKELENAVRFEAEQFIPIPVDELIIRYLNLGKIEFAGEKYFHLLLAAVPTALVYDYFRLFSRAGLRVAAVDLQSLSLMRLFGGFGANGALQGTVGILDIGANTTQLLVVRDRVLQFTRTLPIGGHSLNRSVAENCGFDVHEKQRFKEKDNGLFSTEEALKAVASCDILTDIFLSDGFARLIREIRRSFDYYTALENAASVERLILSGGTSKLKGIREILAGVLGLPANFGSPGVTGLPRDDLIDTAFDPAFAVALGTALREVAE